VKLAAPAPPKAAALAMPSNSVSCLFSTSSWLVAISAWRPAMSATSLKVLLHLLLDGHEAVGRAVDLLGERDQLRALVAEARDGILIAEARERAVG
jgi:hypothetical protein